MAGLCWSVSFEAGRAVNGLNLRPNASSSTVQRLPKLVTDLARTRKARSNFCVVSRQEPRVKPVVFMITVPVLVSQATGYGQPGSCTVRPVATAENSVTALRSG